MSICGQCYDILIGHMWAVLWHINRAYGAVLLHINRAYGAVL